MKLLIRCLVIALALGLSPVLVQGDLFGSIDGSFDLVVANLPYVPERDRPGLDHRGQSLQGRAGLERGICPCRG